MPDLFLLVVFCNNLTQRTVLVDEIGNGRGIPECQTFIVKEDVAVLLTLSGEYVDLLLFCRVKAYDISPNIIQILERSVIGGITLGSYLIVSHGITSFS